MSVRKRKWTTSAGLEKEAWVVDYVDQQAVRRLKTFERKKDADAWASRTSVAVSNGEHVADSATVTAKEAGEGWIKSCTAAGLERATLAQYRQHLDLHVLPYIGRTKLSQLSVPAVRAFQDRLRTEGRSPAMVKRVTVSLGSIIADAQERGLVARNAVREMAQRRGRSGQGERRQKAKLRVGVDIPTPGEARTIIENAKGRWRPFIVTAIFTGLRASELRGLRWADVDMKAGRIHVRQRADRYHDIGMPKSDAGQRSVPIGAMVINTLREWRLACPPSDLDLVFPTGAGRIEWLPNIIMRGLIPPQIAGGVTVPVLDDAGKPTFDDDGEPLVRAKYTGLHSLRHFYASWCINRVDDVGLGLPPKMVQERLGHSSITMTMDVYGHLFPSTDDAKALAAAEQRLMSAARARV